MRSGRTRESRGGTGEEGTDSTGVPIIPGKRFHPGSPGKKEIMCNQLNQLTRCSRSDKTFMRESVRESVRSSFLDIFLFFGTRLPEASQKSLVLWELIVEGCVNE